MDEKRTDLKAALRELAAEEAGGAGPHVGLKRLTAYRRGILPVAERETVQEHLSLCARCTGLLRELKDFEADAASGDAGPEPLRQEAWASLARRLSQEAPEARPAPSAAREAPLPRRAPWLGYAAAAALLLAVAGLSLWAAVTVQQSRQRLALLERKLAERDEALAATQRSLANAERRLDAAHRAGGRVDELAAQVAALTSELAALRRTARAPEGRDRTVIASHEIELTVSPRFALRGKGLPDNLLRPGGAVNPVRISAPREAFTAVLSLADQAAYGEYRLELVDQHGETLWTGRRPASSLLGDAGTSVSIHGLGPGRYRLRIAGMYAGKSALLAEYLLAVQV